MINARLFMAGSKSNALQMKTTEYSTPKDKETAWKCQVSLTKQEQKA